MTLLSYVVSLLTCRRVVKRIGRNGNVVLWVTYWFPLGVEYWTKLSGICVIWLCPALKRNLDWKAPKVWVFVWDAIWFTAGPLKIFCREKYLKIGEKASYIVKNLKKLGCIMCFSILYTLKPKLYNMLFDLIHILTGV